MKVEPLSTLRRRTSEKWITYGDDILPLFVAEMDYPLAPEIRAALHEAVDLGDTGYAYPADSGLRDAFAGFARDRWGWSPSPDGMLSTTDVSVVIVESLRRLIGPGDGVIVTTPVYPPFFDLIPEAGGVVVDVPLSDDGTAYSLDLDGIDAAFAAGARGILLCNPHNPLGLLHTRDELAALSQIVERHDGFVVSDEIHAPLTHRDRVFTPYLTVSDAARSHGIAAESASKAFNLAGLKSALFVTGSERMADLVRGLPEEVGVRTGLFGILAATTGLNDSREWLDETIVAVESNFALLRSELGAKLPGVRLRSCDASYLAWLDVSALGLGDAPGAALLERAKVALVEGTAFGPQGRGYVRMNLACAPDMVIEAVDRIAAAV